MCEITKRHRRPAHERGVVWWWGEGGGERRGEGREEEGEREGGREVRRSQREHTEDSSQTPALELNVLVKIIILLIR